MTTRSRSLAVAVVQGGPSTEAEVSRASALGVARALAGAGHSVVRLELDAFLAESLRTGGYDVVFPVAHGAVGEDGSLQGLLEVLELPYVGSGVLASAMAMHKRVARVLFERAGLPVARGIDVASRRRARDRRARPARRRRQGRDQAVVARLRHRRRAAGCDRDSRASSPPRSKRCGRSTTFAIVEHFARGREVTCGVLEVAEAEEPVALPPTEIFSPNDPFYTYEARYAPGRSRHVCPAALPPAVIARVQEVAVAAHRALGCRDLSRVDFIVGDEGAPDAVTLLEVNTLPGMTATSLYPEAAAAAGITMAALCGGFAARAHARGPARRLPARPMPV